MASDIRVAVGRFAAATSSGPQELTIAGLGWTPKAALFFSVGGIADGILRDDLLMSIGVVGPSSPGGGAGGLNQFALAGLQEDGQATTDAGNYYRNDACVMPAYWSGSAETLAYATGDGDGSAGTPGAIANGWRVDWTAAPDQAYFIVAVFFGGDDLQAHCGSFQIAGALDGVTSVTAPGFQPNLGFFFSNFNHTAPPNATTHFRMLFGVAATGSMGGAAPDQGGLTLRSQSGAGTTNLTSILSTTGVGIEIGTTEAFYRGEIAFDADGFDFTQRDSDGGGNPDYWSYLVLDTGDRQAWAGAVDAPTSTAGDWSVSGPGFRPQAGGLILSNHTAVDSFASTGAPVECMAMSAFDRDGAFCLAAVAENGVSTSNNASLCDDVTARVLNGAQADVHLLSGKPSFNGNGWTVPSAQISTADATARKWIAWAIEAAAGETATASLSLDSAVQKQSMLGGSLTAALRARKAATAQGDAALQALLSFAGELDAALRWALAAQAGLDGALAIERPESAAADAALRRTLAAEAELSGALQDGRSGAASIDALLTGLQGGTIELDAVIAAVRSGTLTLDAALRRLRSAEGSLDAALTAGGVLNASLRAALSKALALTAALSVVVRQADQILKADLDGTLQATQALSASLQGVLQKAARLSGGLNGALRRSADPLTGSLQAALTRTAALVATLSGTVELMRSLAAGLNAALQERAALAALLDAVVGTPPAAYAPRGTRSQTAEGRDRYVVGPDNRIILVPANPRRH